MSKASKGPALLEAMVAVQQRSLWAESKEVSKVGTRRSLRMLGNNIKLRFISFRISLVVDIS